MKQSHWIFLLLLLFGNFLWSVPSMAMEPPNICKNSASDCSDSQKYIEEQFFENGALIKENISNTVYSGACYWNGRGYNPDHKHWGVVFFDKKESHTYFGGKFGFFQTSNPYREVSPEESRKIFERMYNSDHQVFEENEYAFVHLNRESPDIWYYWFTQHKDTGTVYLKAFWTIDYFFMCELQPNKK